MVDGDKFASSLDLVRKLEPGVILSHHLPPAAGITEFLLKSLASARSAPAFVGPDQAVMDALIQNVPPAGIEADGPTKPEDSQLGRKA
jgi:hypothetical protein